MYATLEGYKDPVGMAEWIATLPVVIPLMTSAVLMLLRNAPKTHSNIAMLANGAVLMISLLLFFHVQNHGILVVAMGAWPVPFGITFAVDQFGALFSVFASIVGLVIAGAASDTSEPAERRFGLFPLLMLMMTGVHGSFLTGDIFNLYVWFEVMVISSFGLLILGGRHKQLDGAIKYTFLNLIATSFFLISVGLLYGMTGSLNIAAISQKLSMMGGDQPELAFIALMMITAFLMKSAVFPFGMWLPAAYHTPKIVVAAIMAGLLTKAGLYALLKTTLLLFPATLAAYSEIFAAFGIATTIVGAVGALSHSDIRRMAGYLVISGVGTIIIGLSLNTMQGLSGALFYATQSMILMTGLYLTAGLIRVSGGSYDAHRVTSLYRRDIWLSILYAMFALAIVGLPPFSGLWAKLMIVESAVQEGATFHVIALLLGGLLTLITLGRLWLHIFWGERLPLAILPPVNTPHRHSTRYRGGRPFVLTLVLAIFALVFGLFPNLLMPYTDAAAKILKSPAVYIEGAYVSHIVSPSLDHNNAQHSDKPNDAQNTSH